jgi:FkbH-like protein
LNQKIYEYAETHPDFFVNDIEYLSADYGLSAWSDSRYWHMYKYAMSLEAIPALASSIAIIIKAIYGKNKKVLALDLDNTLWGGVIGDDGVEGIDIGPETSKGQVYYEFQEYCKNLKSIGVLLTIVSKNEEQNALDGLNHSDGVLRPDDFVSIKANWEAKNINIRDMAEELTLGEDSFVFVDDNPAERDIVNQYLPKVSTPDIRTAEQYIYVLDHTGYFEVISLSDEDVKKTELYQAKAKANHEKTAFANYDEYLKSLDMVATIKPFEQLYYQRIAQLTNKSNQFNLTTVRCSVDEIETMANDKNYITLYGKLQDKFGDNGLVTVIAGECIEDSLHIRLWLMSCRVLKRGLEDSMMNSLVELSQKRGMKKIVGYYYPTEKNQMVSDFFEKYGFRLIDKKQKETVWLLDVSDYQRVKVEMTVKSD